MKKFLEDLAKELKKMKISDEEINEIIADHKEMIKQAQEDGLSDEEITDKFGNPTKLAKDLKQDFKYVSEEHKIDDYDLFKSFPIVDELNVVKIQLVSENTIFTTYEGENIVVYFQNIKETDKYTVTFEGSKLKITRNKGKNFIFSSSRSFARDEMILVQVPRSVELDNFNYSSVSGDIEVNNLNVGDVKIKTTSGDGVVTNMNIHTGEFTSVSGEIVITNVRADSDFKFSTVSGDFSIIDSNLSGDVNINTVSGDYEFKNTFCGHVNFSTVSGDLSGDEFYPEKIDLKSVSGDVDIKNNDKQRPIEIGRKKTLSGSISIK